jgi:hypothetical protein
MADAWGGSFGGAWGNAWGDTGGVTVGLVQPVLRIVKPQMRSIDAKSIADNYNRGLAAEADYTWPGGRKFYQDPE